MKYIIGLGSGHEWLVEDAENSADAIAQYGEMDGGTEGDADPVVYCHELADDEKIEYLRDMGQTV